MKIFVFISCLLLIPKVRSQIYGSFFSPYDGPLNGPFGHIPAPSETYNFNRFNQVPSYNTLNNLNTLNTMSNLNTMNTIIPGPLPYRGLYSNPWAYGGNQYMYNNRYYAPYGYSKWIFNHF